MPSGEGKHFCSISCFCNKCNRTMKPQNSASLDQNSANRYGSNFIHILILKSGQIIATCSKKWPQAQPLALFKIFLLQNVGDLEYARLQEKSVVYSKFDVL